MDPLTVLTALIVAGFLYSLSIRIWPYTKGGRCKGGGRNAGSNRRPVRHVRLVRRLRPEGTVGTRLFFRRR